MNAYGAKEVQLHILISVLDGTNDQFQAPAALHPVNSPWHTLKGRLGGPTADLDVLSHASNHTTIPQLSTPYPDHLRQ
jgi:hypothetical protein